MIYGMFHICTFPDELPYVSLKPVGSERSFRMCCMCTPHNAFHGKLRLLPLGMTFDIFCIWILQFHNLYPPLFSVLLFSNPYERKIRKNCHILNIYIRCTVGIKKLIIYLKELTIHMYYIKIVLVWQCEIQDQMTKRW